jgi:hypothetical protein
MTVREQMVHYAIQLLSLETGDKRTADILVSRANGERFVSIGKRYNVTRERIRQIEKSALHSASPELLAVLVHIEKFVPPTKSQVAKKRADQRRAVKQHVKDHPTEAYDYQRLHKKLGFVAPSEGEFTGQESLLRFYRDYKITRIGDVYHCVYCDTFKHKDEYMPASIKPLNLLICRVCNTDRHMLWYYEHHDHALAYAKKQNAKPAAREYRDKWNAKKLLEDPEYFKKKQRERTAAKKLELAKDRLGSGSGEDSGGLSPLYSSQAAARQEA